MVCSILIIPTFQYLQFASTKDEGYYLKYAAAIGNNGISYFPQLFREYIGHEENWLFPNPLRIGHILISASFVNIFGETFQSLVWLSFVSYLLALIIVFLFARKYFEEKTALCLTALLAFSPLMMGLARRALMDSTATLFSLLSVWLFLDLLRKRSGMHAALFILLFSCSILVKEAAILLGPAFLVYLVFHKYTFKHPVSVRDVLSVTVFPFILVSIAYMAAAGNLQAVVSTMQIVLTSPGNNRYALQFGEGPWFRYIVDFMLLSPVICIFSLGFVAWYLTSEEKDERVVYFLTITVCLIFFFNLFTKNIRYVMMLDMPLRLFASLMIIKIAENRIPKHSGLIIFITVLTICAFDYMHFLRLFIQEGVYDPVSARLLKAWHFIP
jgi:4-amino-4-deoxy-L-arabinose transferase-like glycosyltransferase